MYHQWAYDEQGNLRGVPFRRGVKGVGGMPAPFDLDANGLRKRRVAQIAGMLFVSFSDGAPALEDFLGPTMCRYIERVLHKPVNILGYARRRTMRGNWKLYSENSRDGYHGGLLHLFYPTFGIYRPSQESRGQINEQGYHNAFTVSGPQRRQRLPGLLTRGQSRDRGQRLRGGDSAGCFGPAVSP